MISRRIIAAVALLCAIGSAHAQTGSVKTPAQLNSEINSLYPDNTGGLITPHSLRQVSLDQVASVPFLNTVNTFSAFQTFSGGISATTVNGLIIKTTVGSNIIGLGLNALNVANGASDTVAIGQGAGQALTTGSQNVLIGTGGTGAALTTDSGNTLVGYDVAPSLNNTVIPLNFNTSVGNQSLRTCTTCGSNSVLGRAAMFAETIGDHNTAVGHAALFTGSVNIQVTAIGDSAGGAALAGTAIPSGFPNNGTNVFPFNGDTNVECIGETCGKATSAARKQSLCIGSYCRIPARDNSAWLGNGMQSVGTSGRVYDGTTSVTVNNGAGVTLTCAQLLAGIINRTGAPGAGFSDTTPSAQQIVQCATGGVGNSSEVPVSVPMFYYNATGQTSTMLAGSGVTLLGVSAGTNASAISQWRVIITNSTSGAEAVSIFRIG